MPLLQELTRSLPDRGDVECPLARKVVIEKALGDAGSPGDLVDGELVVGLISKELESQIQQLLSADVDSETCAYGLHHAARSIAQL
jgi:hypothetical protein